MTATAGERMYPILPCRDLDEAIGFYEALGFERTYRQVRPNPHAVVARGDLQVHLAGIEGFDPEGSYASVIIVVPDPDALYTSFAAGLRAAYGRLPVSGIPRMVRPRKRWGTVYGFSVVDVGGNWLRFSRIGDTEEAVDASEPGLAKGVDVAARLADSHGDDAGGLATLERALAKYPDAPAIERARALAYRADLAIRLDRPELARASLDEIGALDLDDGRAGRPRGRAGPRRGPAPMTDIEVTSRTGSDGWTASVVVTDPDGSSSRHEVTVTRAVLERLAPGADDPVDLVRRSFAFLLEREPKESILRSFDLPEIGRYFPEYERTIAS